MTYSEHQPYTYLIGWSHLNKFYYGVRYARGCNPSDFWTEYFTSSGLVQQFRSSYGEPDIIRIRRTFSNKHSAILWETRVLRRLNVLKTDKWLNANVAGAIASSSEPKTELAKSKISKGMTSYIDNLTGEEQSQRGRKRVAGLWKKYHSNEQFREHMHKVRSEQINPMKGKSQKRVSCTCCRQEYPVNIFSRHIKQCKC